MSGKFELYRDVSNQYRFRLKAGNSETIGASEAYVNKQGATNGIQSVKTNAPNDDRYTVFQGRDSKYYFNLKAGNGEIILSSQGYAAKSSAMSGIDSVKRNAPNATTVDLT